MHKTPEQNLARAYNNLSSMAYRDVGYRVDQAAWALGRVALCVHHRAAIFGDDAERTGNYITTTVEAAQSFLDEAANSLVYAHFFDTAPARDAHHDANIEYMLPLYETMRQTVAGLLVVAESDAVPDDFPSSPETDDPQASFAELNVAALERFRAGRMSASIRRNQAATLPALMNAINATPDSFAEERRMASDYHALCERQGQKLFEFENRLRAMSLTP